jgi:hypothetical protein
VHGTAAGPFHGKKGGQPVKKAIGLLLIPLCTVLVLSLLVTPQSRIQHQDSSAFGLALQRAVDRLEGGSKVLLAGTATPVAAMVPAATYDGAYTCDTYEPAMLTCDPAQGCAEHTMDAMAHTCSNEMYTCQVATCDTYDPQMVTCDPNGAECAVPHTSEPAAYNHTCDGHTCDGAFTCDFTVDPRALTCDAANVDCAGPTFNHNEVTCNPMQDECQLPFNQCTAQQYPTCEPGVATCDPGDPACATVDPSDPRCGTPVKQTTWGKVKAEYRQ